MVDVRKNLQLLTILLKITKGLIQRKNLFVNPVNKVFCISGLIITMYEGNYGFFRIFPVEFLAHAQLLKVPFTLQIKFSRADSMCCTS